MGLFYCPSTPDILARWSSDPALADTVEEISSSDFYLFEHLVSVNVSHRRLLTEVAYLEFR